MEARYADADFATAVYDDLARSLLAQGTTTAMYFGSVDLQPDLIPAEACLRHGQRALVDKVAMDNPATCLDCYRDDDIATALARPGPLSTRCGHAG